MSNRQAFELIPELQELFDDFVNFRNRFEGLGTAFAAQKVQIENYEAELANLTKQLSTLKRQRTEDEYVIKSYEELKLNYERLKTTTEDHRERIRAENQKRVQELEDELNTTRAKLSAQSDSQHNNVQQIVAEYQTKLEVADQKIRELTYKNRIETTSTKGTVTDSENIIPHQLPSTSAKARRVTNKRLVPLKIEIASRGSGNRGRGRGRGGGTKRKLFNSDRDEPIDIYNP